MPQCHWHPQTETWLTCGSCGRPLCTRCVVQHPVGIRCRECARLRRLPTLQLSAQHHLKASGASLGLGVVGGVALFVLGKLVFLGLFLQVLALIGVGYLVGEGVSRSVNRKRGRSLQAIAGAGVVVGFVVDLALVAVLGSGAVVIYNAVVALLALAAGVWVAVSRVGPY